MSSEREYIIHPYDVAIDIVDILTSGLLTNWSKLFFIDGQVNQSKSILILIDQVFEKIKSNTSTLSAIQNYIFIDLVSTYLKHKYDPQFRFNKGSTSVKILNEMTNMFFTKLVLIYLKNEPIQHSPNDNHLYEATLSLYNKYMASPLDLNNINGHIFIHLVKYYIKLEDIDPIHLSDIGFFWLDACCDHDVRNEAPISGNILEIMSESDSEPKSKPNNKRKRFRCDECNKNFVPTKKHKKIK